VNILAEGHLPGLVVVTIVGMMAIGLEIAKQVIGGTSAIDVDSEATLSVTAETAQDLIAVLRDHGHGLLVDMENLARASLAAAAAASADPPQGEVAAQ